MPRKNRTTPTDRARDRLATAAETIANALTVLTTPALAAALDEEALERMAVRHLTAEHYGRWVDLPPRRSSTDQVAETVGGRLVGIREDPKPQRPAPNAPLTRVLLLQSGTRLDGFTRDLNDPVDVAPRSWS
jgi:hypothetical protein